MCYICFSSFNDGLRLLICFVIYLAVSFFMGGGLTFLYSVFNTYLPKQEQTHSASSLLFPAALLCAAASLFLSRISNRFLSGKQACLIISNRGKQAELTALVDSGNLLCDPISGLHVILLNQNTSRLFVENGDFSIDSLCTIEDFHDKLRAIPTKNMEGSLIITAFIPDSLKINGKESRGLVAFSNHTDFGGNQALLPSSLLPLTF